MTLSTIAVIASPHPQDEDFPWIHDPESFCDWVWEVLLAGCRDSSIKVPWPWEAIELAEGMGYTLDLRYEDLEDE